MPTFDELFGKPAKDTVRQPQDILPESSAIRTGHNSGVRDVMLGASPFQSDAADFFNQDAETLTLESNRPDVPVGSPFVEQPRPGSVGDVSGPVDALTEALGPSIDNIARFGEFGGGFAPSSELSLDELREAVRAVLARL